ncbi:inverse autotransporter beta domain-containing protein [Aeromonas veronii]|uniref:inverse autotransporter beta domain-containing protein n=1 Tax=Aeromonas veronii TaxID=654 RepID=UPI003BA0D805
MPTLAGENPLHLKEDTANAINVEQKVAQHAARLGQAFSVPDEVGTLVGAENESEIVKGARRAQRNSIAATGGQESTSAPSYGAKQETQYWRQQLATQFEEEANAYATSLLGGMGTARTRMTLDDQFSLASAEADVLLPLVEDKQSMLFTQFGLRRNEQERTIANLGVGQRHFLDRWMLGYNLFADYDLTNQHWRAGLGAEAWRDYLKLGANFYTPLSGWRDSSLFEGMEERAARGMDVRLEAYLPSYPQWSASLTAEQYLGDRVDLLGSEQLERDPHAITAGLHYNPFPLLKMDVEQVEASGGQSDTRFTLGVEWTLGATLSDMLNPSRVDKSLAGMRHDLVERNNDMVLEYRDKVALKASLNDLYSAPEGQSLTLTLNVQHSHQIASIQWFGPILEQSGLTPADTAGQDKLSLTLPTLPAYRADQSNEYRVVAMVTDINGQEASAEGVVVVTEDGALQPSIQLAERFVQLRAGERYQIDWGVVDPRQKPGKARSSAVSESIEGDVEADRDGYQYHYRLTFQGPEQVLKGRELVAPGQPNPGTRYRLDVEVTFPSGHVARDSMEFEFISDTEVTDPAAKPQVSNLRMAGKLEVGQSLTATYAFNANGGDTTDSSTYAWGNQGETTAAAPAGQVVANSGVVPGHTLVAADVGEVKEVSVQAKNGLAVTGNTVTVDAQGNASDTNGGTGGGDSDTEGGDGNGGVTDPAAKPQVSNLRMAGKLEVGQSLTATYAFNANGGDATDNSTYVWGNQGETAAAAPAGQTVANSGVVPGHTLVAADVGEVKEVSVQAKNGLAVTGNTVTVDTTGSDGVTGGNPDGTVDYQPAVAPIDVRIEFTSTATVELNGVLGGRPVLNNDTMTAVLDVVTNTSPDVADYTFKWCLESDAACANPIAEGVGMSTFLATDKALQGERMVVEVVPVVVP